MENEENQANYISEESSFFKECLVFSVIPLQAFGSLGEATAWTMVLGFSLPLGVDHMECLQLSLTSWALSSIGREQWGTNPGLQVQVQQSPLFSPSKIFQRSSFPFICPTQIEKSLVFSVIPLQAFGLLGEATAWTMVLGFSLPLEGEGSGSYGMPAAQSHQLGF